MKRKREDEYNVNTVSVFICCLLLPFLFIFYHFIWLLSVTFFLADKYSSFFSFILPRNNDDDVDGKKSNEKKKIISLKGQRELSLFVVSLLFFPWLHHGRKFMASEKEDLYDIALGKICLFHIKELSWW